MARPYKSGTYIFPPKPEHKIKPDSLHKFDDGTYITEPKLNGSNCTIYLDGKSFSQRNRHQGDISNFKLKDEDILPLYRGKGDMVIVGEYMNKSQKDKSGKVFNNKFVIFDILVYNGEQLIGSTTEERVKLLKELYGGVEFDEYLYIVNENVFMVKFFEKDFLNLYNSITLIDMYEGLVLKRKSGKLERGAREKNNMGWQCKTRKPTLNYQF